MIQYLSHHHLRKGLNVFWKINLTFFINMLYGVGLLVVVNRSIQQGKILKEVVLISFVYMGGYFAIHFLNKWLSRKFDLRFFAAQFSIFNSLIHITRGLIGLLVISVIFFPQIVQNSHPIILYSGLFIVTGSIVLVMGLYGWMVNQFQDLKVEERL